MLISQSQRHPDRLSRTHTSNSAPVTKKPAVSPPPKPRRTKTGLTSQKTATICQDSFPPFEKAMTVSRINVENHKKRPLPETREQIVSRQMEEYDAKLDLCLQLEKVNSRKAELVKKINSCKAELVNAQQKVADEGATLKQHKIHFAKQNHILIQGRVEVWKSKKNTPNNKAILGAAENFCTFMEKRFAGHPNDVEFDRQCEKEYRVCYGNEKAPQAMLQKYLDSVKKFEEGVSEAKDASDAISTKLATLEGELRESVKRSTESGDCADSSPPTAQKVEKVKPTSTAKAKHHSSGSRDPKTSSGQSKKPVSGQSDERHRSRRQAVVVS